MSPERQCRGRRLSRQLLAEEATLVAAFFAAGFLAAAFGAEALDATGFGDAARSRTASRPALRSSSDNSPLPATRASTMVPIMVASAAIACLRADLLGPPWNCSDIISII